MLLREAGENEQAVLQPAIDLLRALILKGSDANLSSSASAAYARWPAARRDQQVVAVVWSRLATSSPEHLKNYLRAAYMMGIPPDPNTQALLEGFLETGTMTSANRKIVMAILGPPEEPP
jgi:hypothetical protein